MVLWNVFSGDLNCGDIWIVNKHTLNPIADTLPQSAAEDKIVEATSPSLEQGSLPQLVRHSSKESKAEETRKNRKMIIIKNTAVWNLQFIFQ